MTGGSIYIDNVPDFLKAIKSISSNYNTIIQAMDAGKIAGEKHLLFSVQKALRAKENNCCMAHDLGIEIMRYASGKKQIGEAFSMGVHEGQMNVAFVVLGENEDVELSVRTLNALIEEAPVMNYASSKRAALIEQFLITEEEIWAAGEEMLQSLVMERVALVDILK